VDDQLTQLNQAIADQKAALTEAVDRIDAKLAALADSHPDLTTEIEDIRADTATIAGLAADPAPTPTPAPAPDAAPPVADTPAGG
jgi:ABC-type transporter Mla subunit MlaD